MGPVAVLVAAKIAYEVTGLSTLYMSTGVSALERMRVVK